MARKPLTVAVRIPGFACFIPAWRYSFSCSQGVSGRLVGSAVFKAVEASFTRRLVGSIPIHSR